MAKPNNNNKRKAASSSSASANKKAASNNSKKEVAAAPPPSSIEDDEALIGGVIFPEELESTIEVLTALSSNPELLKKKEMKGFKGAMWDCWRALQETTGTGPFLPPLSSSFS